MNFDEFQQHVENYVKNFGRSRQGAQVRRATHPFIRDRKMLSKLETPLYSNVS